METIFATFDIAGPASDARTAVLVVLGFGLVVMALNFVKSVLFGGSHFGDDRNNNDD